MIIKSIKESTALAQYEKCVDCHGTGEKPVTKAARLRLQKHSVIECEKCGGVGYHGVPTGPTAAPPGSDLKVVILMARRAHGLWLWNIEDCKERGEEKDAEHVEPGRSVGMAGRPRDALDEDAFGDGSDSFGDDDGDDELY